MHLSVSQDELAFINRLSNANEALLTDWSPRSIPGLAARIWDNDGEFLLIEAALHLPKWLKPEVASNRVWLHQGSVHLLPLPSRHNPNLPAQPTLAEALQMLDSPNVATIAGTTVLYQLICPEPCCVVA